MHVSSFFAINKRPPNWSVISPKKKKSLHASSSFFFFFEMNNRNCLLCYQLLILHMVSVQLTSTLMLPRCSNEFSQLEWSRLILFFIWTIDRFLLSILNWNSFFDTCIYWIIHRTRHNSCTRSLDDVHVIALITSTPRKFLFHILNLSFQPCKTNKS